MITTYFKNLVMNHMFHTSAEQTLPAKYYLGWSTAVPNEDGTGFAEPDSATGYARIELEGLSDAVDGMVSNSARLSFAEAISNQGKATAYGVFDAQEAGNLLIFDELNPGADNEKKTVEGGTTLYIKPSETKFVLKGL